MLLEVLTAEDLSPDLLMQVRQLVAHLTERHVPLEATLQATLGDPAVTVLAARHDDGGKVLGMLSLIRYTVPTGSRARIEDLVVEPGARGIGVGQALVEEALRMARQWGSDVVDLTSNPSREAAHRLYLRLGFVRWPTNVYRLQLRSPEA